ADTSQARRPPKASRRLVGRPELGPVSIRALEVVAEDLLVFRQALTGGQLEPSGQPFVPVGTLLLGHGLVGRVADQEVAKAEGVLPDELRTVGADQLLAGEGEQASPHLRPKRLGRQGRHGALRDGLGVYGGALAGGG